VGEDIRYKMKIEGAIAFVFSIRMEWLKRGMYEWVTPKWTKPVDIEEGKCILLNMDTCLNNLSLKTF